MTCSVVRDFHDLSAREFELLFTSFSTSHLCATNRYVQRWRGNWLLTGWVIHDGITFEHEFQLKQYLFPRLHGQTMRDRLLILPFKDRMKFPFRCIFRPNPLPVDAWVCEIRSRIVDIDIFKAVGHLLGHGLSHRWATVKLSDRLVRNNASYQLHFFRPIWYGFEMLFSSYISGSKRQPTLPIFVVLEYRLCDRMISLYNDTLSRGHVFHKSLWHNEKTSWLREWLALTHISRAR